MSFRPESVDMFMDIFRENWQHIRAFNGCDHVELLQDSINPSIFFTYSLWQNEEYLNTYRDSELFTKVWGSTKILFNAKPEAWTVKEVSF